MQAVFVADQMDSDVDVKGVAHFLSQRFALEALYPARDPDGKTERLLNLVDQISALPGQHNYDLEARKAAGRGLRACLNNLPREQEIQEIVKISIVVNAGCNALDLNS